MPFGYGCIKLDRFVYLPTKGICQKLQQSRGIQICTKVTLNTFENLYGINPNITSYPFNIQHFVSSIASICDCQKMDNVLATQLVASDNDQNKQEL